MLPQWSKITILLKMFKSDDFFAHELRWETSYFEDVPPDQAIAYKHINNLCENDNCKYDV